jgi:hypothetical protein
VEQLQLGLDLFFPFKGTDDEERAEIDVIASRIAAEPREIVSDHYSARSSVPPSAESEVCELSVSHQLQGDRSRQDVEVFLVNGLRVFLRLSDGVALGERGSRPPEGRSYCRRSLRMSPLAPIVFSWVTRSTVSMPLAARRRLRTAGGRDSRIAVSMESGRWRRNEVPRGH